MTISITEKRISEDIIKDEKIIGTRHIKYPHFECDESKKGKKLCEKMNVFYAEIAKRFSHFSDKKLVRTGDISGIKMGMNYIISLNTSKIISVVIDLYYYDEAGERKKRFSQLWSIQKGDILLPEEVLKKDYKGRKKLFSLVYPKFLQNMGDARFNYYDNAQRLFKRYFSFYNFFAVPDGLCFFIDSGILSPHKYGTACFILPFSELCDIKTGKFWQNKEENE